MVLAASPFHPLATRSRILPADLNGVEFVSFDDDLPIQRGLDRFLREQGLEVNRVMHFDNLQMIKEAVAHQVGVGILPARTMLDEIAQGRLVAIPIDASGLFRPLGIIHRKKKRFNRVAQAFLNLLCEAPLLELAEPLPQLS
jgi:DNA-binding transcriptional LysR family regulator